MSITQIAYSPNDFYYVTSGLTPTESVCNSMLQQSSIYNTVCCENQPDKTKCSTWNENSENCFKYELCKNKQNADLAIQLENNNAAQYERHGNYTSKYNNELLKTFNITTSIAIITYLSVYFFKQ
jgi:hypothetical protein